MGVIVLVLLLECLGSVVLLVLSLGLFMGFVVVFVVRGISRFVLNVVFNLSMCLFVEVAVIDGGLSELVESVGSARG